MPQHDPPILRPILQSYPQQSQAYKRPFQQIGRDVDDDDGNDRDLFAGSSVGGSMSANSSARDGNMSGGSARSSSVGRDYEYEYGGERNKRARSEGPNDGGASIESSGGSTSSASFVVGSSTSGSGSSSPSSSSSMSNGRSSFSLSPPWISPENSLSVPAMVTTTATTVVVNSSMGHGHGQPVRIGSSPFGSASGHAHGVVAATSGSSLSSHTHTHGPQSNSSFRANASTSTSTATDANSDVNTSSSNSISTTISAFTPPTGTFFSQNQPLGRAFVETAGIESSRNQETTHATLDFRQVMSSPGPSTLRPSSEALATVSWPNSNMNQNSDTATSTATFATTSNFAHSNASLHAVGTTPPVDVGSVIVVERLPTPTPEPNVYGPGSIFGPLSSVQHQQRPLPGVISTSAAYGVPGRTTRPVGLDRSREDAYLLATGTRRRERLAGTSVGSGTSGGFWASLTRRRREEEEGSVASSDEDLDRMDGIEPIPSPPPPPPRQATFGLDLDHAMSIRPPRAQESMGQGSTPAVVTATTTAATNNSLRQRSRLSLNVNTNTTPAPFPSIRTLFGFPPRASSSENSPDSVRTEWPDSNLGSPGGRDRQSGESDRLDVGSRYGVREQQQESRSPRLDHGFRGWLRRRNSTSQSLQNPTQAPPNPPHRTDVYNINSNTGHNRSLSNVFVASGGDFMPSAPVPATPTAQELYEDSVNDAFRPVMPAQLSAVGGLGVGFGGERDRGEGTGNQGLGGSSSVGVLQARLRAMRRETVTGEPHRRVEFTVASISASPPEPPSSRPRLPTLQDAVRTLDQPLAPPLSWNRRIGLAVPEEIVGLPPVQRTFFPSNEGSVSWLDRFEETSTARTDRTERGAGDVGNATGPGPRRESQLCASTSSGATASGPSTNTNTQPRAAGNVQNINNSNRTLPRPVIQVRPLAYGMSHVPPLTRENGEVGMRPPAVTRVHSMRDWADMQANVGPGASTSASSGVNTYGTQSQTSSQAAAYFAGDELVDVPRVLPPSSPSPISIQSRIPSSSYSELATALGSTPGTSIPTPAPPTTYPGPTPMRRVINRPNGLRIDTDHLHHFTYTTAGRGSGDWFEDIRRTGAEETRQLAFTPIDSSSYLRATQRAVAPSRLSTASSRVEVPDVHEWRDQTPRAGYEREHGPVRVGYPLAPLTSDVDRQGPRVINPYSAMTTHLTSITQETEGTRREMREFAGFATAAVMSANRQHRNEPQGVSGQNFTRSASPSPDGDTSNAVNGTQGEQFVRTTQRQPREEYAEVESDRWSLEAVAAPSRLRPERLIPRYFVPNRGNERSNQNTTRSIFTRPQMRLFNHGPNNNNSANGNPYIHRPASPVANPLPTPTPQAERRANARRTRIGRSRTDREGPRNRAVRMFAANPGDYVRDEDFDASYEGLLALAESLGPATSRATPRDILESLPTGSYKDWKTKDSDSRCPICLDDYTPTDRVLKAQPCNHWCHQDCLRKWLHTARTCPVCRAKVKKPGSKSTKGLSSLFSIPGPSRPRMDSSPDSDDDDSWDSFHSSYEIS